jgi:hypothetical protein
LSTSIEKEEVMSDFDRVPRHSELEARKAAMFDKTGSGWGWILGVLFVVLIVGLVIAGSGNKQTADDTPVPNTTGQATRTVPLAPPLASRPAMPPVITGQAPSQSSPATTGQGGNTR